MYNPINWWNTTEKHPCGSEFWMNRGSRGWAKCWIKLVVEQTCQVNCGWPNWQTCILLKKGYTIQVHPLPQKNITVNIAYWLEQRKEIRTGSTVLLQMHFALGFKAQTGFTLNSLTLSLGTEVLYASCGIWNPQAHTLDEARSQVLYHSTAMPCGEREKQEDDVCFHVQWHLHCCVLSEWMFEWMWRHTSPFTTETMHSKRVCVNGLCSQLNRVKTYRWSILSRIHKNKCVSNNKWAPAGMCYLFLE